MAPAPARIWLFSIIDIEFSILANVFPVLLESTAFTGLTTIRAYTSPLIRRGYISNVINVSSYQKAVLWEFFCSKAEIFVYQDMGASIAIANVYPYDIRFLFEIPKYTILEFSELPDQYLPGKFLSADRQAAIFKTEGVGLGTPSHHLLLKQFS